MFETKFVEKSKDTFYVQYPPPPENRAGFEIMWETMAQPDRSRITM
jgi:hypothetical protein